MKATFSRWGTLPTMGSCGQLFVKLMSSEGWFVRQP